MLRHLHKLAIALALLSWAAQPLCVAQPPGGDANADAESCDIYGTDATYTEVLVTGGTDSESYRDISASGCPNHMNFCQKPHCTELVSEAVHHETNIQIPSYPRFYADSTNISLECAAGLLGIALNGVSVFGQTDGTPQCGDAIASEGTTFDVCGGHAAPSGEYHYHNVPQCLLDHIGEVDGAHSPQIGWSLDGFPVYGPFGPSGVMMYPCTNDNADAEFCLDGCNGYRGEVGVDEYLYRYYASGGRGEMVCSDIVENSESTNCDFAGEVACCTSAVAHDDFWPYIIGCRVGCTFEEMEDGTCDGTDAFTTDFTVSAVDGYADQHVIDGFSYDPDISSSSENSTTDTDGVASDDSASSASTKYSSFGVAVATVLVVCRRV